MQHRTEIDGLRGVAVISVILFHAGFPIFQGGYVGVDVFFVVSGYLIASIIISELDLNTFSLLRFYERRVRRIIPPLFLVMAVCLPFSWAIFFPEAINSFSFSLIAVTAFVSNIFFWQTSGYFDTASELKPLIHTWSLALEEQYYIFFPLLMMLCWKKSRRFTLGVLAALFFVSLMAAQWFSKVNPSFAFYMLPTRLWEFISGVFIAFFFARWDIKESNYFAKQSYGLIGFLLIIYTVITYSDQTPNPSFYNLVPVLGTVLIIVFATQETLAGKILGSKFLVGMGVISYSAYLWHQPIFAFVKYRISEDANLYLMTVLSAVSTGLAYLSWKYVETPFRKKNYISRRHLLILIFLCSLFFVYMGWLGASGRVLSLWEIENQTLLNKSTDVIELKGQSSNHVENEATAIVSKSNSLFDISVILPPLLEHNTISLLNLNQRDEENFSLACAAEIRKYGDADCVAKGSGNRIVVVWGDSHAKRLSQSIPTKKGVLIYVISHPGCPPIVGVRRFDGLGNSFSCNDISVLANYANFIKTLKPEAVFLVGRWTLYLNGYHQNRKLQSQHHFLTINNDDSEIKSPAIRLDMLKQKLLSTVNFFSEDAKIVVLSQPPDFALYPALKIQGSSFIAKKSDLMKWHHGELNLLSYINNSSGNVKILDSKNLFCDVETCYTRDNGRLLYSDDNHLTFSGSQKQWEIIFREIIEP
jgi:peptidoglycan/LPS O-acetylase OafA/YrhL